MANVPLTSELVEIPSPNFAAINQWRYIDPFEAAFVAHVLAADIPQRIKYQNGKVWAYRDDAQTIVAFGSLSLCTDYGELTGGALHTYIPLLAVHPNHRGQGRGKSVVEHLVGEAACIVKAFSGRVHNALFLDVYEKSSAAIGLYEKCGFQTLAGGPFVDPINHEPYRIMAKRVD